MKKLIITANPSSKGFTHKIADKLNELSLAKNDEVEILDLYKTKLKQDFLRYEEKSEI
jgi:putative NADPH-quinone reductase